MESKKSFLFRILLSSLMMIATSISNVVAQDDFLPPPQARSTIDSLGVDMINGTAGIGGMNVDIGTKASGIESNSGRQRYSHDNLTGTLTRINSNTAPNELFGLPSGIYIKVDTLGYSEVFRESGELYVNERNTGGIFSCSSNICTYTTTDGTVVLFDKNLKNGYQHTDGCKRLTNPTLAIPRQQCLDLFEAFCIG